MKKFVFSLQPVYKYKLTVEKLQKADLRNAQAALRALLDEDERLVVRFERSKETLEEALRKNEDVAEALSEHDVFFRFIRDARKALKIRIIKAEEHKARCEALLIGTMKEIKTYKNLRAEQYMEYQQEVKIEEEKNMSDLVSFNVINDE